MGARFEGMTELQSQIAQLGLSISTHVEEKALEKAAEFLQSKIEDTVTVKTGKLQENITISSVKDGAIEIGPAFADAFYGHFLEFGTSKMSAKPFMQNTFEDNSEETQEILKNVIKRELNL
jgi:HK97 gp10 family phage protein